ncbi:rhomboid family protein [Aquirufa rosea]|uniref:Rhomboid family intramembrane serine protease n=1 Tax=Aquirufa rosea TaxID=2509241 RepID=A0A4Q1BYI7_9BACT|nr:rhomboid family intramembrane serine protease [Aquirufa rosea]RXK48143.1 rhomboid family intramembrane serine protease [Aquirufa rosea]
MKSIWQDIKLIIQNPENGLWRLILTNIFIFVLISLSHVILLIAGKESWYDRLLEQIALSSQPKIALYKPWTFISYFFAHFEIFHLVFNMLFLYWFGSIIQSFVGQKRLIQLYFLGGLAGAIAFILLLNSFSYFVMKGPIYLNGASASVFAIVVGAATIQPNYKVHLLILGEVSIKYVAAFYIIWSMIETTGTNAGGNIAHLGGALLGFLYAYSYQKKQLSKPAPEEKIYSYSISVQKKFQDFIEQNEAEDIEEDELNAILDKISTSGYESLTKHEKKRLFKASQKND